MVNRSVNNNSGISFSLSAKLMLPALLIIAMLFSGNTYSVRPVVKEKQAPEKKEISKDRPTPSTTDYLLYIMPKEVTDISNKSVTYKKDANGVYTIVQEEGC